MQGAMVTEWCWFWMVVSWTHAIEFRHGERALGITCLRIVAPVSQALVGDGTLFPSFLGNLLEPSFFPLQHIPPFGRACGQHLPTVR